VAEPHRGRWRRRQHQGPSKVFDRGTRWLLAGCVVALVVVVGLQYWFASQAQDDAERAVAQVDLATFSIYLHRQGCPTDCPVYAVLARGDGTVEYEGVRSVATVGAARGTLDALQARALALAALRAGLPAAPAQLLPGAEGCQEWDVGKELITIGARFGATTHTVAYYAGCKPGDPNLERLAREVDGIVGSVRWTRPGGAP